MMLTAFAADYLSGLSRADFAPKPTISGRLSSCDGLLMEAVGLSLPVGTICSVGDTVEAEVIGFRGGRTLLMNLGGPAPLLPQSPVRPIGRTGDCGSKGAGPPRFISNVRPPRKPITSASTVSPTEQIVPTGRESPTASISSPSQEDRRPEMVGLGAKSARDRPER